MKETMWTFKKIENKWEAIVNADFLFYMHSTMGFPVELSIEEIKGFSKEKLLMSQLESWKIFSKENNINLDEIRKSNLESKGSL